MGETQEMKDAKPRYTIPLDPPSGQFAELGELMARWSWIENQTAVLIRELLRISKPEGNIAINGMMIGVKLKVLLSLAAHTFATDGIGKDLQQYCKKTQDLDEYRNDLVHGWLVEDSHGVPALLRVKNLQQKVNPHPDTDALKDLPKKLQDLRDLQNEAQRITRYVKSLKGKFS